MPKPSFFTVEFMLVDMCSKGSNTENFNCLTKYMKAYERSVLSAIKFGNRFSDRYYYQSTDGI